MVNETLDFYYKFQSNDSTYFRIAKGKKTISVKHFTSIHILFIMYLQLTAVSQTDLLGERVIHHKIFALYYCHY